MIGRTMQVQIILGRRKDETTGGYIFHTTIGVIQDLDRAHQAAFEAKLKRDAKKAWERCYERLLLRL
jgi:hypothetical protein